MVAYGCRACSYTTARWLGFCPQCKAASPLEENVAGMASTSAVPLPAAIASRGSRRATGIDEFDRVLGGGFVPGAVVLLAGEPGVGKSTLLLEAAAALAERGESVLVASAEESSEQVGRRASRIGADHEGVLVASVRDVASVLDLVQRTMPSLVIVDSMQAVSVSETGAAVGSPGQVREAASRLIAHAKANDVAMVLVGHVTKDGSIAGPKLLEHMVDVVVALEGDPELGLRFLRSSKNRFGSINEVGVFRMEERGLVPVADPTGALLEGRDPSVSGSVLFPTIDGLRSLTVEVQALVVATRNPQARRSVKGLPVPRLHQVLAVLERHAAIDLGQHDVYVSVMGGLRLTEPAADLPVAIAVASSFTGVPVGMVAAFGEVGLTGELRSVSQAERRSSEAERLGVRSVVSPATVGRLPAALIAAGIDFAPRRAPTLDLVR